MEWVEVTGKTIEEALERALDQLGVDASEAEYEVVSEPRLGILGRLKAEARIRARIRPTQPRPKDSGGPRGRNRNSRDRERPKPPEQTSTSSDKPQPLDDESSRRSDKENEPSANQRNRRRKKLSTTVGSESSDKGTSMTNVDVPIERQGEMATEFLEGLFAASGSGATVSTAVQEDGETVVVSVSGAELGHFIGPRGDTLQSVQELTRTAVQRRSGARNGRIVVDIAQYREKRKAALERFAIQVADEVKSTNSQRSLEPMHPADRKIVHDTINDIDGVETTSEGEEPRRRVVVRPTS